MKNSVAFVLVSALVACTVPDSPASHQLELGSGSFDLAGADFAIAPGSIGAACTKKDANCTTGKSPICWESNILDNPGNLPTPGGYCSSTCTADADCGSTGICQEVVAGSGKFCLRSCAVANTCRAAAGYACFVLTAHSGYCYPSTRLSCNPTQVDSSTQNGTCPGVLPGSSCIRRTFEDLGECRPLCSFGTNTCATSAGQQQHCVYLDTTVDSNGNPTRDKFKGLTCFPRYPTSKLPGASCSYFDECVDGYQCNVLQAGDRTCRQLCIVGDPSTCTSPQVCRDAFSAGLGKPGFCF